MNKEKHIEEMARAMCPNIKELQNSCEKCEFRNPCVWQLASISLHEKGYRKASEVAREIFVEIEKTVFADMNFFKELKKKYTEE